MRRRRRWDVERRLIRRRRPLNLPFLEYGYTKDSSEHRNNGIDHEIKEAGDDYRRDAESAAGGGHEEFPHRGRHVGQIAEHLTRLPGILSEHAAHQDLNRNAEESGNNPADRPCEEAESDSAA